MTTTILLTCECPSIGLFYPRDNNLVFLKLRLGLHDEAIGKGFIKGVKVVLKAGDVSSLDVCLNLTLRLELEMILARLLLRH